jgi:hypothetical protein
MARTPPIVRKRDLKNALEAMVAAGCAVQRVEIVDGKITVIAAGADAPGETAWCGPSAASAPPVAAAFLRKVLRSMALLPQKFIVVFR